MSVLLEAFGVSRNFSVGHGLFAASQTLRAVVDVNLAVGKGEVLGLVGESGSGKSTLAKMLLGILKPSAGLIRFGGADVASIGRRALARRIQPVFQDPYSSLNPRRTVASIVGLPLAVQGIGTARERRMRSIAMLDRVGLAARHADVYPNELSGGQR
ncbi:MAG: ATP-binding cassette domain-containing protein, partial [Bradyrhizobium sp.]|nr:ATP-binding cassette domain-containing protein [Bradyrhizobium sp.]